MVSTSDGYADRLASVTHCLSFSAIQELKCASELAVFENFWYIF
jgi:hypothetical protein